MAGPVNNVFAVESTVVKVILKDLKCSVPCIMDGAREKDREQSQNQIIAEPAETSCGMAG